MIRKYDVTNLLIATTRWRVPHASLCACVCLAQCVLQEGKWDQCSRCYRRCDHCVRIHTWRRRIYIYLSLIIIYMLGAYCPRQICYAIDEFGVSSEHFCKHDACAYSGAEICQHAIRHCAKLGFYSKLIEMHNNLTLNAPQNTPLHRKSMALGDRAKMASLFSVCSLVKHWNLNLAD